MLDGEYQGKHIHRVAGWPREEHGSGLGSLEREEGGVLRGSSLRFCFFVGNTALLAANLLFEMLCALPKVTVV